MLLENVDTPETTTSPLLKVDNPTKVDIPETTRLPIPALPEISTSALMSKLDANVDTPETFRSSNSV